MRTLYSQFTFLGQIGDPESFMNGKGKNHNVSLGTAKWPVVAGAICGGALIITIREPLTSSSSIQLSTDVPETHEIIVHVKVFAEKQRLFLP